MRYVAAVPAVGLLAGAAAGLLLPSSFLLSLPSCLSALLRLLPCWWAWRAGRARVLAGAVVAAVLRRRRAAVGGCVAAGMAAAAADGVRAARAPAAGAGRRRGTPAARRRRGVRRRRGRASRRRRADRERRIAQRRRSTGWSGRAGGRSGQDRRRSGSGIGREGFRRAYSGGIVVTVIGSLAADRIGDWRAGRRVRLPVTLRRPSRYLDPGVPDHERALARRGTTLVGTVKSGALVEVLQRGGWVAEAMSGARAFARRAIADGVGRWSAQSGAIVAAIVIGDRAGLDNDVQRRLQEAGTYHVIAISGGNIAILAGLLLSAFRARRLARADRDAVVDRRAPRLRRAGRQRRIGRSGDADGGGLFRRRGPRISAARRSTRWRWWRRSWSCPIR